MKNEMLDDRTDELTGLDRPDEMGAAQGASEREASMSGKRSPDELFAEVKERMVMRLHGASRQEAREILKKREAEIRERRRAEGDDAGVDAAGKRRGRRRPARFISAADFFLGRD